MSSWCLWRSRAVEEKWWWGSRRPLSSLSGPPWLTSSSSIQPPCPRPISGHCFPMEFAGTGSSGRRSLRNLILVGFPHILQDQQQVDQTSCCILLVVHMILFIEASETDAAAEYDYAPDHQSFAAEQQDDGVQETQDPAYPVGDYDYYPDGGHYYQDDAYYDIDFSDVQE